MGSLANAITGPLGVKLFKGGGYSDGGALDRQQQQAAPAAAVGNQLIQQGSHLPGLGEMGVLQYLPQIFAALSAQTGAVNPLASSNNVAGANFNPDDPTGSANPKPTGAFDLNPVQQSELNHQQSQVSTDVRNAMARVKANLASRGLTHSSHANAAEAYLRNEMMKRQNTNRAGAGYNAYQSRLDTTNQFGNMLNSIYGQQNQRQQGLLSQGQNLIAPQLQNTGAQANLAQQNSQNAGGALGSLAGSYFGGLFNQPKQNPFVRPGQSGFDTGAGNQGGVGPTTPSLSKIMWNFR